MPDLDFLEFVGLTPQRWVELQEKLRGWVMTEKTPARVMRAMMDDIMIGYREQVVLAFYLGYSQGEVKGEAKRVNRIRVLNAWEN